jgi:hypothetical protein
MRSWKRNLVIFLSRFKHGFEIDKYNVHWSLLWYLDLCLAKPFLDLHDFPQRSHGMEIPVMWFASMWSLIWFLSTQFTYSYSSLAFVRISIVTEHLNDESDQFPMGTKKLLNLSKGRSPLQKNVILGKIRGPHPTNPQVWPVIKNFMKK